MKILSIAAGAAGMYCGSCLRDNALAAEMRKQGHDVILLPLYTPLLTDEKSVAIDRVFFGGISIYLKQQYPAFRKLPRFFDKLWDSRWALKMASKSSIPTSPEMLGGLTVATLQGRDGALQGEVDKLVDWLKHEPLPDVVNLPNSLLISLAEPLRSALGRPVCVTLSGEDLFLEGLPEPYKSQSLELIRKHSAHVEAFIATSNYYADFMSDYLRIPRSKIEVVPLGINLEGLSAELRIPTNCFTVGYFARVCPEKGLHLLAEAYRKLRRETDFSGATLEAAGYLAAEHKPYLTRIEQEMKDAGLEREFQYRGALDRARKIDFLRNLSVISVPSPYAEPKGLYLLEAMACGVPYIQPNHGAFPELHEKAGAGWLFEANSVDHLAEVIYSAWRDQHASMDLGKRGVPAVNEHFTIERSAQRLLEVYGNMSAREETVGRSRI